MQRPALGGLGENRKMISFQENRVRCLFFGFAGFLRSDMVSIVSRGISEIKGEVGCLRFSPKRNLSLAQER